MSVPRGNTTTFSPSVINYEMGGKLVRRETISTRRGTFSPFISSLMLKEKTILIFVFGNGNDRLKRGKHLGNIVSNGFIKSLSSSEFSFFV